MKKSRIKPEPEEQEEGTPAWMLTYSDLVTQLLLFFVMLFSMATVDKAKFEDVAFSLRASFTQVNKQGAFNFNSGQDPIKISEYNNALDSEDFLQTNNGVDIEEGQANAGTGEYSAGQGSEKLDEFSNMLQQEIIDLDLGEYVSVVNEEDFTILRLSSVILFDSGSADIRGSGKEILIKLGGMLDELDNGIVIQGHTDNRPINTVLFPTNWELSTKRATNIVLFLVSNCGLDPTKLTAQGNGEYRPVAPNDTEKNMQKNRRIDIVIEK